jgi:hypothetical protein
MMIVRLLAAGAVLLACAGAASAQVASPAEPATPARVQLGPLSVRPQVVLRDVGYDSNVFNEAHEPEGDFTATVGAKVDVGVRMPRLQATYTSLFEYVYFQSFESERGSNRGVEGRADLLLGRLQPYLATGINRAFDRPTSEIDERSERQQAHVEAGLRARLFSRTIVSGAYRRTAVEYAGDETFRGISLADAFNGTGEAVIVGTDLELTPLTTLSVHGERVQDRFDLSPERDADSYRLLVTATTNPLALVSGRASLGIRAFRPLGIHVPEFTGLTAAIAVGYSAGESTRLNLTLDRDLRYSFDDLTPFYISTGGRLTVTQQLTGTFDAQAFGGIERIAYEARLDALAPVGSDHVRIVGGSVGYRLGDGARLALNVDRTARSSPRADRGYSRARAYTSLSYGF